MSVTVIDYDQSSYQLTELNNESLEPFLKVDRPACSKVRWINVQGISFDVIKMLGLKYK